MKLWNAPVMDELDVDMTLGGVSTDTTEEKLLEMCNMAPGFMKDVVDSWWDKAELSPSVTKPTFS